MSAEAPSTPRPAEDPERERRNQRIGLIVAAVLVICGLVAGISWYSGGGSADVADAPLPVGVTRAGLAIGPADAPITITVVDDLAGASSRLLDQQTRDFLEQSAAAGAVRVEYRPVPGDTVGSAAAVRAFGAVLTAAAPKQVLAFRTACETGAVPTEEDLLRYADAADARDAVQAALDRDADAFLAAAERRARDLGALPAVFVDGRRLAASDTPGLVAAIEDAVASAEPAATMTP